MGISHRIVDFTDIELEKAFVFLKYLNKKLPKRQVDHFDISDTIDLDSLRIQKVYEHVEGLVPEDATLNSPGFETTGVQEPEYDLLSEIIKQANKIYGANLTEEDKLDLSRLNKRLVEDSKVRKYMSGNSTEDNKQNFFKKQFESAMGKFVKERFEFYKKMADNPEVKNHIFKMMYKDYMENNYGQPSG